MNRRSKKINAKIKVTFKVPTDAVIICNNFFLYVQKKLLLYSVKNAFKNTFRQVKK